MTVGIYIRVSTLEQVQEGYSIAAQKERLLAYCTAQGWADYKFYVDEGVSAKDTKRPELTRLFDHIKQGQIDMILVYRLDRFTRRVVDLHKMLEEMDKYNCAFKSATEPYDTSTAMGRMFIGLVALLAQWETENLSERIKMALEEKVSGGERVGGIPYGFDLDENEKLVANDKAVVVLDMIKKINSGMSANAIASFLTKTNNDKTAWHPTAIYRILQNPALYGATRWNDQVYEDTHTGIISKEEFLKLQTVFDDRKIHRLRDVKMIYLFQGVLVCASCGNVLSVNRFVRKRKDGSERRGVVYKCQACWKQGREMKAIGEQRFLDAVYEYMKHIEFTNIKPEIVKDKTSELKEQLRQIERKREKYQKAWAIDKMTDEEFNKLMDETRPIYDELKMELENTKSPARVDIEAMKKIVSTFNENFSYLTQKEKRNFITQFIRKIEFKLIPQPPKDKRNKKGKDMVVITNIDFY